MHRTSREPIITEIIPLCDCVEKNKQVQILTKKFPMRKHTPSLGEGTVDAREKVEDDVSNLCTLQDQSQTLRLALIEEGKGMKWK